MAMCLPQQCGVVCAAHDEAGGGAAVAEGERRIARTEGRNIGEGEGGSAAFGGEDNGLDALRAEVGQIGKDAMQGCRLMGDINVENIADLVQLDQLDVLEDVGLSRVKDTQAGGDGAVVAAAAAVGDIAVLHRIADRAGAVLAAAVAFDRRPAAPLMAEGGQLLRLSDDTAADRAAALALALLGAGGLFGDDPLAEGVGLADGDGLGLGIVATDAVTVLGALLDTGSVPVDDPLAVLVAEGLDDFGPGIAADGTGEGPHAVGSAGGLLRDDACIPLVGALIHRDALGLGSAADDAGIGHDARLGAGRGLGHDARAVAVLAGGVERFGLRIAADLALVGDGAVLAAGSRCRGEDFPLMLAGGGDDMAQDKKPVTVNHYLRDVRVFLNWCMDDDHHYIEKPFKMKEMTMQDTKPKAFCDEDMARLMEKPNLKADFPEWRTYAIVCWIMDNGSRTETVCCAKMSDVDFKNKTITFSHTKNRKAQVVGMSDALSSILKEYIRKWRYDVGGDAWLFPNIGGEQLMGEWTPLRVQAVLSEPGREAAQCAWSAAYLFALLYKK